ncbi:MAG: hypothetical protein HY738_13775 [Bacteroidia bacterium]|nr:hypothetical protein [Bacteroidia bacterium]
MGVILLAMIFAAMYSCRKDDESEKPPGALPGGIKQSAALIGVQTDEILVIEQSLAPGQTVNLKAGGFNQDMSMLVENKSETELKVFMAETAVISSSLHEKTVAQMSEKQIMLKDIGLEQIKQFLNVKNPASDKHAQIKVTIFSNPYESYGVLYDKAFGQLRNHPGYPELEMNYVYNYINTFIKGRVSEQSLPLILDNKISGFLEMTYDYDLTKVAELFYTNGLVDHKEKQIYTVLNTMLSTSQSVDILSNRLKNYEKSLYKRNDLTMNQKLPLLATSAILRYGCRYWEKLATDDPAPLVCSVKYPAWLGGPTKDNYFSYTGTGSDGTEILYEFEHYICAWGAVIVGWKVLGVPPPPDDLDPEPLDILDGPILPKCLAPNG